MKNEYELVESKSIAKVHDITATLMLAIVIVSDISMGYIELPSTTLKIAARVLEIFLILWLVFRYFSSGYSYAVLTYDYILGETGFISSPLGGVKVRIGDVASVEVTPSGHGEKIELGTIKVKTIYDKEYIFGNVTNTKQFKEEFLALKDGTKKKPESLTSVVCEHCGTENDVDAYVCKKCGENFPAGDREHTKWQLHMFLAFLLVFITILAIIISG